MNHMTTAGWLYAMQHLLEGHDVAFAPVGRSMWDRPFMGGRGEVRPVFHPYCLTCKDERPKITLGEPLYSDELTHWAGTPPGTSCPYDPRIMRHAPIGMFHCPDCGAMVLAGYPHPSDADVREQGIEPYRAEAAP
jgi:hypothetical protein